MGFPSPAQDYLESSLCLNQLCIARPSSTQLIRMPDASLAGQGILEGSLVVIDRSIEPKNGDVCAFRQHGEDYIRQFNHGFLVGNGPGVWQPIPAEDAEFIGVGTWIVNVLRQKNEKSKPGDIAFEYYCG